MKKLIGVLPLWDEAKQSIWMLPGYMKALEKCGAVPIILPFSAEKSILDEVFELCSGFLITGGQDVDPSLYGAEKSAVCGEVNATLDSMEKYILMRSAEENKAIFGICRGVQIMNVCFGGTLYQDIPSELENCVEHHMSAPYNRAIHCVTVADNTVLADIIDGGNLAVNSYHHQAVKDISPILKPCADSEDGICEALYYPGKKFYLAVQWHPELDFEENEKSLKLFKAFVDAC